MVAPHQLVLLVEGNDIAMAKTIIISIKEILRVLDGDSMEIRLDHGRKFYSETIVRLNGLDTPEVRGAEKVHGLKVKEIVQGWIEARKDNLMVISYQWEEKFGRLMVDLREQTLEPKQTLCQFLLANKLARPYLGEKRFPWTAEELAPVIAWTAPV